MCFVCDSQFDLMTTGFADTLTDYVNAHKAGKMRDTAGERVHDQAFMFMELCENQTGQVIISWYLAVAMERLTALECSGIPT